MTSPAPTPPDYVGSANSLGGLVGATGTGTSGSNPLDVWHLGNYYNQPIGLGVEPSSTRPVSPNGQDLERGKVANTGGGMSYGKTQDYISNAAKLWAEATGGDTAANRTAMQQYVALQNSLFNAGAYGSTSYDKIRWGQWDGTDKALVNALQSYEDFVTGTGQPMTFDDYLAAHRNGGVATGSINQGGTSVSGGSGKSVISLTDPAQIREAAQQAAQSALGHVLTGSQLDNFVNQFHAAQTSAESATSGSASMPDLSAQADLYAQTGDNAQEFANHQAQGYVDTFLNMFLTGQSQRGGVQPVTPVSGSDTSAPAAAAPAGRG